MPYKNNAALPAAVRGALPDHAQSIFRHIVNSEKDKGLSDERAFSAAWSTLKRQGWSKGDNGKWRKTVAKSDVTISGATLSTKALVDSIKKFLGGEYNSADDTLCDFCECPAVKALMWAGNSQHMYVCPNHIETGISQIVDSNHDAINQTIDLMPASASEQDESGEVEIKITIHKDKKEKEVMSKQVDIKKEFPILKRDDEKRLITGVVLEPEVEDAHGDVISEEEVEDAAHDFMMKSRVIGLQHKELGPVEVVESFITKEAMKIGDEPVVKGAWVMTVKVHDDSVWESVKKGEFTGFSIGGTGMRS